MSRQGSDVSSDALSLDDLARIDRICVEFERAWKEGREERVEDRLVGTAGPVRDLLLRELLALELHHRRRRGESPSREELCRRFRDDADVVVAVLEAEDSELAAGNRTTQAFGGAGVDSLRVLRHAAEAAMPRLPERYRPVREVARGGMGAVWRVIDRQFSRPLAVKVMLPHLLKNREAVARFEREAQLTGSLQHPGIPPVADRGTLDDGSPYFSMKLVRGETLASILAKRGNGTAPERGAAPHPIADLTRLLGTFEQVCHAIGYAHSQGVIHRDLKPANIMVGAFGEVQVMDWGMAKRQAPRESQASTCAEDRKIGVAQEATSKSASDTPGLQLPETVTVADSSDTSPSITRDGTVTGTPAYMPPEQARGEVDSLDSRSDVFGLGAILCEILTGERPYTGNDVWRQAAAGDVADATARLDRSGADRELVELCKRCLSPDAANRPHNASAVAEAVQRYAERVRERLEQEEAEFVAAEAEAALRKAIEVDPNDALAFSNLGWLLMHDRARLGDAEDAFSKAIEIDPACAKAHWNLGLLLMLEPGRFAEALESLKRGHELGTVKESWQTSSAHLIAKAKQLLQPAPLLQPRGPQSLGPDWDSGESTEALVLGTSPLEWKARHALAAKLFAEAIDDASIDDELRYQNLYAAATAAARVAAGNYEDAAAPLSFEEKAAWRMRALRWLREKLSMLQQMLASRDAAARTRLQQLAHWLENPDLAALRGAAIEQLPADERAAWRDFWADVDETRSRQAASAPDR